MNKNIDIGVLMNALAHMSIGLGSNLDKNLLRLDDYRDADGNHYPNISEMPFIILRGKNNEIRKLVKEAKEKGIQHGIYLDTMTGGSYLEQLENTRNSKEESLTYYGCVLFGNWDTLSELTRKFSLWK